jgi:hypothetical protein
MIPSKTQNIIIKHNIKKLKNYYIPKTNKYEKNNTKNKNNNNNNNKNSQITNSKYYYKKRTNSFGNKLHNQNNIILYKKENESTKISSSLSKQTLSLLDYTFNSHKENIIYGLNKKIYNKKDNNTKEIQKLTVKNKETKYYLYDLEKTFDLNIDFLKNLNSKNKNIINLIENIKKNILKKKELRKKVINIKGKMLIERQIQEESKRKINENKNYYKDQINSVEEKNQIKEEYIIQFLKKLYEVEIFTNRNSKIIGSGFEKYKNFSISEFVEKNTKLFHNKGNLFIEINEIMKNLAEVKNENLIFKKEEIIENWKYKKEKKENINKNKIKINKYIDSFKKNCRIISMRMRLLRNCLKNMSKTIQFLNVPEELKNKLNKKEKEEKLETSRKLFGKEIKNFDLSKNTNLEITKKLESFMDFSLYLNNNNNQTKSKINDLSQSINMSKFGDKGKIIMKNANFGDVTYNWEISRINKKHL